MRLPSESMYAVADTHALKVVSSVQSPDIIAGVKLRGLILENLESKTFHVSYQYYGTQVGILSGCFLNPSVPYL